MFLGGILYEPNPAGTIIPDTVDGKKVVLYDPANPPVPRRRPANLFEVNADGNSMTRVAGPDELLDEREIDEKEQMLPADVVLWNDEDAKAWVPEHIPLIKGHPKLGVEIPLSALTPGLSKSETEAAISGGLTKTLVDKAEEERKLLDPDIVGVQSLGPGLDDHAGQSSSTKGGTAASRKAADEKAAADKRNAEVRAANTARL